METTFSPGPWKALRGADDDETRWIVVAAGSDREYLIATIENGQPGDCLETEGATAQLIAQAPALVAALSALLAFVEGAIEDGTLARDIVEWEEPRQARAVLAAIRGATHE